MTAVTYKPSYTIPSIDDAIAQVATHLAGVHEACEKVPKIGQNDFDRLVEAIKADGLLRPIEINEDNLIVDGRSRIQACAAAGITLNESDFVTTNEAPLAIARSNNARRHLNEDQKAMEAARLLEEEKKRGAQKRAEGAMKGRQAKQASLGTDSVPSETPPKKRAPRSVDIVAAETGVSRENITLAEKVLKADPEISKQVEQGDLSLEDAAKKSGVVPKKPTKPSVPKSAKPEAKDRPAKVKPNKSPSVWKDDLVEITDSPNGIRTIRCDHATFYIHTSDALAAVVMSNGERWCWHVGIIEDLDCADNRKDAEKAVLERLSSSRKNDA